MRLPDVGAFELSASEIVVHPHADASPELVLDAYRRTVLPMALQVLGHEVLHASGVVGPRGVVALCALSETGKSTLAFALSRRRFRLWGDDAVAVDLVDGRALSIPLEFRLSLREASAEHFGTPGTVEGDRAERPLDLATICILERVHRGADATITRVSPAEAFPTVLAHGYCFDLENTRRKRQMMDTYLELVSRVEVLRVRFRPGFDRLPFVLDALESAIT
jgi:hypothetical protein